MKTTWLPTLVKATAVAAFAAFFLASCGKENTLSAPASTAVLPSTAPATIQPQFSQTTLNELNKIKSQIRCSTGEKRVEVHFYSQNSGTNSTSVQGPFSPGYLPGTSSAEFIGISQFGDIMVVSKIGSSAHNVTLYLCPAKNLNTATEIIGPHTRLTDFAVDQVGIILDQNSNCASGNVDRAYTGIKSSGYMNGQQYIETMFYPYCQ